MLLSTWIYPKSAERILRGDLRIRDMEREAFECMSLGMFHGTREVQNNCRNGMLWGEAGGVWLVG
jgi:hypothetical protein